MTGDRPVPAAWASEVSIGGPQGEVSDVTITGVDVSVDIDGGLHPPAARRTVPPDKLEFSLTIPIDADTVECPRCGTVNAVPESPVLLRLFAGDDPLPCENCRYPLL